MSIATVTSKGQITIPQDVRERLGIVTGTRVEFGIRRALRDAEDANVDLADAIIAHAAIDAGCDGIVTFDKAAQRLPGMLPVG